ncbi:MAG: cellulose biosynthesis cyclic di-GMP-binding regulatory protein BcsB, partial [Chloroflexi bacterium]|nr:cellulose biosynthesis cyclic di-GMP-binding regulatory protein BcsB [Chloroflexota bacterium]
MSRWTRASQGMILSVLTLLALVVVPTAQGATIERRAAPPSFDQAPPPGELLTLAQLGFTDQIVNGIFPNIDFWFPGPGEVNVTEGSVLRLVLSYPDILLPDLSTVTVQLNNYPIATYKLARETAKRFVAQVDLP